MQVLQTPCTHVEKTKSAFKTIKWQSDVVIGSTGFTWNVTNLTTDIIIFIKVLMILGTIFLVEVIYFFFNH